MSARFVFLGTGPAEAIPRAGHADPLCLDARKPNSKSRRRRSAGLYVSGRTSILFDAGPDVLEQLAGERVERLGAVLLTHAHGDAAYGLPLISDWAKKRGLVLPVYTEKATERRYGRFPYLEYRFVKPGAVVPIGRVTVSFFRVRHSATFPTLGFRIGDFAYASDNNGLSLASRRALAGVTDFALDGTFWFGTNFPNHFRVDQSIALGQKLGVMRLYLTQCGHTFPLHAEAQVAITDYTRKLATKMEVTVAWDGMELKLK